MLNLNSRNRQQMSCCQVSLESGQWWWHHHWNILSPKIKRLVSSANNLMVSLATAFAMLLIYINKCKKTAVYAQVNGEWHI